MLKARVHPHCVGGRDGYRYSVLFDGKLLVDRSRDPECDAARALLAKGITGKLTLLDGKTGIPRTVIDIEKAATKTVEEGPGPPRLRNYRERCGSSSLSHEVGEDGQSVGVRKTYPWKERMPTKQGGLSCTKA